MIKKTLGVLFLVSLFLATPIFSKQADSKKEPIVTVEGLQLNTLNHGKLSLNDYKGKLIILDFFATWCPPCVAEIPHFIALQKKYGDKLVVIGLSVEDSSKPVLAFIKKRNIHYPVALATEKAYSYFPHFSSIPTTILLNKKREVVATVQGYESEEEWESRIKPLL